MDSLNVISQYTRADAIADGVLVDLMRPEFEDVVRTVGFKIPIAITHAAYCEVIDNTIQEPLLADIISVRVKHLLEFLHAAIRIARRCDTLLFDALNPRTDMPFIRLKCVCHPSDDVSPALTIMLPNED